MLEPTVEESRRRDEILDRILDFVERDKTIRLPQFDPAIARPNSPYALVGLEPNDFGGCVGDFRYQFEGEEDLLHLLVTRSDGSELSVQEGQSIAGFVLCALPSALIWLKPGIFSQHFYFGHDELLRHLRKNC